MRLHLGRVARRGAAFAIDWLVMAAWGGLLFGAVVLTSGGVPDAAPGPWLGQAIGFVSMTLPVLLYFALCESRSAGATLGKRALGLRVVGPEGSRAGFGRALARNALKLAPWELGHLSTHHVVAAGDAAPAPWVWAVFAASMAFPAWWVVGILVRGRAPYDVWAACDVTERT